MVGPHQQNHTERLVVLLHPGHNDYADLKGWFLSFNVTPSDDRVLCVYAYSEYSTRKQLTRGRLFQGPDNCMENKNIENENKIMLGDFNCTMDNMGTNGGNKTQRICSQIIDFVPIIPSQISSLIMGFRIYGKG